MPIEKKKKKEVYVSIDTYQINIDINLMIKHTITNNYTFDCLHDSFKVALFLPKKKISYIGLK